MSTTDLLKKLPGLFNSAVAGDTNATFQLNVTEPVYVKIASGKAEVHVGQAVNPDLTMAAADEVLIKVLKGDLNGMMAIMTGKMKVTGNLMLAQKMATYFDFTKL